MSEQSVGEGSDLALGRLKEAIRICSVARSLFDPACGCIWASQVVGSCSGLRSIKEIPVSSLHLAGLTGAQGESK